MIATPIPSTSPPADLAAESDRRWFRRHPGATVRVRSVIPGEFPAHPDAASCRLVLALVRRRRDVTLIGPSPDGHTRPIPYNSYTKRSVEWVPGLADTPIRWLRINRDGEVREET
jgi:hypothetical protein